MVVFAVVLLVLAALLLTAGVVLFGNGVRVWTRPEGTESPDSSKRELRRLPWGQLFSTMGTSVKALTNPKASHDDRLKAAGGFAFLSGIVLVCLAILAFLAALL